MLGASVPIGLYRSGSSAMVMVMAEKRSSGVRHWIVLAILIFPYSLLLGLIQIFEHCAGVP